MLKRIDASIPVFNGEFYRTRNFQPDYIYSLNHLDLSMFDEVTFLCIDPLPFSQPFVDFINKFIDSCFLPCSLSFRINSIDDARRAFDLGADRIVVNSSLWDNPSTIAEISNLYGAQSIVASLDIIKSESRYLAYNWFSRSLRQSLLPDILLHSPELFGEVKIQSVLRDGSVLGPDKSLLQHVLPHISKSLPISYAGGLTSWKHYVDCLSMPEISCVSCTNVHHFSLDSITALKKFCVSHDLDVRLPQ